MWGNICKAYKQSIPLLTLIIAFITVLIGWNQYNLSKKQHLQQIKRSTIERLYSTVTEMNHETANLGHIGRVIMRRGLVLKGETNKRSIYKLPEDYKKSLSKFYSTWDTVNTKLSTNMHSLTNYLHEIYRRLTYSIAFARNESSPDPWSENYTLTMVIPESGKIITVGTDEGKILPYGECFSVSQRIYDNPEYDPVFSTESKYHNFLDNCIELGSYAFDIQDDLLFKTSNHLMEVSFSE